MFAARSAGRTRALRPQSFREREAERQLLVVPGRPHRHRHGRAADPDLERLLDGDHILGVRPRGCGRRRPSRSSTEVRSSSKYRSGERRLAACRWWSSARERASTRSRGASRRAQADRAPRGARQSRDRGARPLPPVRADDADGLLALALTLEADLVVIGPEGPLVAGVADELRAQRDRRLRPKRRGGPHRGVEVVREGRDAGGRRAGRGDALGRATAVRREGRRPRLGQGRLRLPDGRGDRRGAPAP